MVEIKNISSKTSIVKVSELATSIWSEHYIPIIGAKQVTYMLNKFQSEKAIHEQIFKNHFHYYGIYFNTLLIGYFSIRQEHSQLFLSKIYILKNFRGQGYGENAINFIITYASQANCETIYLTVNKNNINAIKFYEKFEFKKSESLVIDIGNGYIMDDFKMIRCLSNKHGLSTN